MSAFPAIRAQRARSLALVLLALPFAGCADTALDDSFGGSIDPKDNPVDLRPAEAGACPANHVSIAAADGTLYCVHQDFCLGRIGDFCGEAPKGLAGTADVQIWGDAMLWCRASGTLVQAGAGTATITSGDDVVTIGAAQLSHDDAGCISNPDGFGMRDVACDAPPARATTAAGFEACSAARGTRPESTARCAFTTVTDHRGAADVVTQKYEVLHRETCDQGCELVDGSGIHTGTDADVAAACVEDRMVRPLEAGGTCRDGYVSTPVVTADGRNVPNECVSLDFCTRETTAAQSRFFCEGAPADVTTGDAWGARRADIAPGQVIIAGGRGIFCSAETPSLPTTINECPAFGGIEGECLGNQVGFACRDATAESRNPDWKLIRDCVDPRTLTVRRNAAGALADPSCQVLVDESAQAGFDRRSWALTGNYCSDYATPRRNLATYLEDFRWNEYFDARDGHHDRRLDVFRIIENCASRGLACVRQAFGHADHCQ